MVKLQQCGSIIKMCMPKLYSPNTQHVTLPLEVSFYFVGFIQLMV